MSIISELTFSSFDGSLKSLINDIQKEINLLGFKDPFLITETAKHKRRFSSIPIAYDKEPIKDSEDLIDLLENLIRYGCGCLQQFGDEFQEDIMKLKDLGYITIKDELQYNSCGLCSVSAISLNL